MQDDPILEQDPQGQGPATPSVGSVSSPQGPDLPRRAPTQDPMFAYWVGRGGDQLVQQNSDTLRQNWATALRTDPNIAGEAQQLAKELGVPAAGLEQNLDVAREMVRRRALREQEVLSRYPILAQQMSRLDFVKVAQDDLDNLKGTESTLQRLGQQAESARLQNDLGQIGARMLLGIDTEVDRRRLSWIRQRTQDIGAPQGFLEHTAGFLGGSAGMLATAAAVGGGAAGLASIGGPIGTGAAFGIGFTSSLFVDTASSSAGSLYLQFLDQGYDRDTSRQAAIAGGLVDGVLQTVGMRLAGKLAEPLTEPIRQTVAKAVAGEVAQAMVRPTVVRGGATLLKGLLQTQEVNALMGAQRGVDMVTEEMARRLSQHPDQLTSAIQRGEFWQEVGRAYADAFQATTLVTLPGPFFRFARDAAAAREANSMAQTRGRVADLGRDSLVRERNPDQHAEAMGQYAEAADKSSVWVDGQAFQQVLQQLDRQDAGVRDEALPLTETGRVTESLRKVAPDVADQVQEAAQSGGDVEVPRDLLYSRLAGSDLQKALEPHVRESPDAMSQQEAGAFLQTQQQQFEQTRQQAEQIEKAGAEMRKSAQAVEDRVRQQLRDTKQYSAREIDAMALLHRDFAVVQASRMGLTPEQFSERYPLRVVVQKEGTAPLNQNPLDNEAFRKWFGKSKVVDDNGAPKVLYHGTAKEFSAFDTKGVGAATTGNITAVWGSYFSPSGGEASNYATMQFHGKDGNRTGAGGRVILVYLSLQNPFEMTRQEWGRRADRVFREMNKGEPEAVTAKRVEQAIAEERAFRSELERQGYDGIIIKATRGVNAEYVAFNPEQIKSAIGNRGTFDPADPNILHAGDARGGFDPASLTAMLFDKADASTFLHESAHYFLTVMGDMARQADAAPDVRQDFQKLLDWFGVKDAETWAGMSLEEQRRAHEQFAYSFEQYLHDGKAPSAGLRGAFQRFSQWLRRVYRSIRDELGAIYRREFGHDMPVLTGEVRQLMDRMLASEDEIAHAEAVRQAADSLMTRDEWLRNGGTDETWARREELRAAAHAEAVDQLASRSIGALRWVRGARSRVLRDLQRQHDQARQQAREQVQQQVEAEPIRRAEQTLRHGEVADNEGKMVPAKLDRDQALALVPAAERDAAAEKLGKGRSGMLRKGGLSPDVAAEMFGMESGDELVRSLLRLEPLQDEIERRTDALMLDQHDELVDPQKRELAVEEAIHNEARARFVAAELANAQRATTPVRVMLAAAKEVAARILANRKLGELSPREFAASEARASRRVEDAMQSGDGAAVIEARRQLLVQNQLARMAVDAQREVERAKDGFAKLWKPDDELAKTRNVDLLNAARFLLGRANLATDARMAKNEASLARLRDYSPEMWAVLEPTLIEADRNATPYRDLTLQQFRDLRDTVQALWDQSRREKQMQVEGRLVARETVTGELTARLLEIGVPDVVPTEASAMTPLQVAGRTAQNLRTLLRRPEHWMERMDGARTAAQGPGPFVRYLWRPIQDALTQYRTARIEWLRQYHDIAKGLELTWQKIAAPEIGYTFANKAELLGALLQSGNSEGPLSNMWKLVGGRRWGEIDPDTGVVDTSRWRQAMARFMRDGTLTKRDLDYAQAVWDLNEKQKPLAQKVWHELYGVHFEEVPATSITTPWGEYRGGYMPAKEDPFNPNREVTTTLEREDEARKAQPSTTKGFGFSRVVAYRPLSLDMRLVEQHASDVLRFSHLQPAIRDALGVLRDREFSQTLNRLDPTAIPGILMPWLERTAAQVTEKRAEAPIDRALNYMRRNAGIGTLAFSVHDAFLRTVSFVPSMLRSGVSRTLGALLDHALKPGESWAEIAELSGWMAANRMHAAEKLGDAISDMVGKPSVWRSAREFTQRSYYVLQGMFHSTLDATTWRAAYRQALDEMGPGVGDEAAKREAVARADAAVRQVQGSHAPEDLARYEVSTPLVKLLTQFTGHFVNQGNLLATEAAKGRSAAAFFYAFMAPALLSGAILKTASGRWREQQDEEVSRSLMRWLLESPWQYGTQMLPVVGPAMRSLLNAATGAHGGDTIMDPPVFQALERGLRGIGRGARDVEGPGLQGRDLQDLARVLTLATGLPFTTLARPIGYLRDVETGTAQPSGALDYARGLVTGQAGKR